MKKIIKQLSVAAVILATSVAALAYNDKDKSQIEEKITQIQHGFKTGDGFAFFANMSPKVLETEGVNLEELKQTFAKNPKKINQTQQVFYLADLEKAKVIESVSGTEYVLFPVLYIDKDVAMSSVSMAVEEAGEWYVNHLELINVTKAYPEMAKVNIDEMLEEMFADYDDKNQSAE
ncbi:hypothetical protein VH441_03705 [Psychrobacter sp. HD31]|uniref:hypothetical protein n=1 Tax=Psychrobacter sp. HD31 TaxID=3112003 RepID=UPI003DA3D3E2